MDLSNTIILCAGPINTISLPVGTNLSNAMIPVLGKPVVGWILDDLMAKGIFDATVVLRQEDKQLASFLERAYMKRMNLYLAPLTESSSIVESLRIGVNRRPVNGTLRVIRSRSNLSVPGH